MYLLHLFKCLSSPKILHLQKLLGNKTKYSESIQSRVQIIQILVLKKIQKESKVKFKLRNRAEKLINP